jgi:glycosyltransferase involved in cell wall biosynthesis
MKIGFDVSQTGNAKSGCGYFADGLIRELAATDCTNEYILYPAVGDVFWDRECTATFACDHPNFRRLPVPRDFETSRRFWCEPAKDFEQKLGSPDLVHANNFYCPLGLRNARLVYTLYDLSFLHEPRWTTEQNRSGCFRGVFRASLNADSFVAISKYTKQHFLSTFPHVPEDRVALIYPASRFEHLAAGARPERFRDLSPGGFWLAVGTIEPRKNYHRLLDACRILRGRNAFDIPLVVAGAKGWLSDDFNAQLQGLERGRDLLLPGYVSDAELAWLFQNCFAFIYPSLFEGFGMPVLEALGFGSPVLCSQTSSLPEVAGDAAIYFDPMEPESIAQAMSGLLRGDVNRERLEEAAHRQAKEFSWTSSAAGVRELYQEVMTRPKVNQGRILAANGRNSAGIPARSSRDLSPLF